MKSTGNLSTGLLVILIGLAIVVILTTCVGCSNVVPYNTHPKYASTDEGFRPIHYAGYPDGKTMDVKERHLIDSTASQPNAQRVKNMNGLFGPQGANDKIEIYSDAKGGLSDECMVKSSGLSNSQGYLCLNDRQIELLKTRGGNQPLCGGVGCKA